MLLTCQCVVSRVNSKRPPPNPVAPTSYVPKKEVKFAENPTPKPNKKNTKDAIGGKNKSSTKTQEKTPDVNTAQGNRPDFLNTPDVTASQTPVAKAPQQSTAASGSGRAPSKNSVFDPPPPDPNAPDYTFRAWNKYYAGLQAEADLKHTSWTEPLSVNLPGRDPAVQIFAPPKEAMIFGGRSAPVLYHHDLFRTPTQVEELERELYRSRYDVLQRKEMCVICNFTFEPGELHEAEKAAHIAEHQNALKAAGSCPFCELPEYQFFDAPRKRAHIEQFHRPNNSFLVSRSPAIDPQEICFCHKCGSEIEHFSAEQKATHVKNCLGERAQGSNDGPVEYVYVSDSGSDLDDTSVVTGIDDDGGLRSKLEAELTKAARQIKSLLGENDKLKDQVTVLTERYRDILITNDAWEKRLDAAGKNPGDIREKALLYSDLKREGKTYRILEDKFKASLQNIDKLRGEIALLKIDLMKAQSQSTSSNAQGDKQEDLDNCKKELQDTKNALAEVEATLAQREMAKDIAINAVQAELLEYLKGRGKDKGDERDSFDVPPVSTPPPEQFLDVDTTADEGITTDDSDVMLQTPPAPKSTSRPKKAAPEEVDSTEEVDSNDDSNDDDDTDTRVSGLLDIDSAATTNTSTRTVKRLTRLPAQASWTCSLCKTTISPSKNDNEKSNYIKKIIEHYPRVHAKEKGYLHKCHLCDHVFRSRPSTPGSFDSAAMERHYAEKHPETVHLGSSPSGGKKWYCPFCFKELEHLGHFERLVSLTIRFPFYENAY